ncbi:hypothetical protein JNB71_19660 [Rhizobium herbae]|uniref:Uncharacterized protein n=1 Tax=Rhizobium herbae TaxID=508661 RepID=A0ABS7HF34_9HYPH|nr:hypothetical protein [Rhizobium herbae]MBW9065524.1 hypothetical protein [Rhizobium herbae]
MDRRRGSVEFDLAARGEIFNSERLYNLFDVLEIAGLYFIGMKVFPEKLSPLIPA